VSADAIAAVLVGVADPDLAAEELVKLAMNSGGPDNVTCIVADIVPVG
jgi:protein phosphatase